MNPFNHSKRDNVPADTVQDRRGPSPRSALAGMQPYVPGRSISDIKAEYGLERVVKLASNENPLGPSPLAMQAVRGLLSDMHRYPDDRAGQLRSKLAAKLSLPASGIIVANGADELITLICEAYLEPGDRIVTYAPTFSEYAFGGRLMNADTIAVPLVDSFALRAEDLLSEADARTKLVFVCSPNNPTGTYMPKTELEHLRSRLPDGCLLVLDAAYSHFADAADYTDGFELLRSGARLVVLQTFSKAYGLAGIRAGFAAGPADVIAHLLAVKEPFNVNALAQAAAAAALDDEAHLEATLRTNAEGRIRLRNGLGSLGIRSVPSQSNFVLANFADGAAHVYGELLRRGIIVRSGAGWGLPDCLRISVGTAEEIDLLLASLSDILQVAPVTPCESDARRQADPSKRQV
ncbi:histidinol-phosphate transaminase [Cohnella hashimotonis]|uniref:Histidinol-phosphate aminotransferase n=1 Tax=Cohnella hashimotonis TaxID=2826895 RepID=A0ABT6TGU6_9BACL|nr:histidinol-phosphate transaminase [Cohnella hashimotonis]MDI4645535.1 histidinol-phosphate transaminase [Cohnella hashimotonis]